MHDTTKDTRILTAQFACGLLKKSVKQKPGVPLRISRERLSELASACESAVLTILYLYQAPDVLVTSDPLRNLTETMSILTEAYDPLLSAKKDHSLLRANIRWCIRTLRGLGNRLGNPGTTLASGVDLVAVRVGNVISGGGFFTTWVNDGLADYTVITNLSGVEAKTALAAAFLPPREIGGTVSEAMFLGSDKRTEPPGTIFTENQVDAKEAASILYEELAKHS